VNALKARCRVFSTLLPTQTPVRIFVGRRLITARGHGAMRVLTALDWLDQPVHSPARLIDTTLLHSAARRRLSPGRAVYVLYRCAQPSDHRRAECRLTAAPCWT
jgi:hypothetical protein